MPIDLKSSLKKTSQWAFSSPLLNSILGSSLFIAIIIAILMVLLVMVLYPAQKGTPFSVVFKMFLYMFFGTLLIVFLHDGVIKAMMDMQDKEKEETYLMNGSTTDGKDPVYGQTRPVNPELNTMSGQNTPEKKLGGNILPQFELIDVSGADEIHGIKIFQSL